MPGRVIFIGRPERRKGLDVLLQAWVILKKGMPSASLVLVGAKESEVQEAVNKISPAPLRSAISM